MWRADAAGWHIGGCILYLVPDKAVCALSWLATEQSSSNNHDKWPFSIGIRHTTLFKLALTVLLDAAAGATPGCTAPVAVNPPGRRWRRRHQPREHDVTWRADAAGWYIGGCILY